MGNSHGTLINPIISVPGNLRTRHRLASLSSYDKDSFIKCDGFNSSEQERQNNRINNKYFITFY